MTFPHSTAQTKAIAISRLSMAAVILLLFCAVSAFAQGTVMPAPVFTGFDSNGDPISNGKLCSYLAGTSTPQATFSDVLLMSANTNPVQLSSAGRATIFLAPGVSYKFILLTPGTDTTCNTGSTVWSQDNV